VKDTRQDFRLVASLDVVDAGLTGCIDQDFGGHARGSLRAAPILHEGREQEGCSTTRSVGRRCQEANCRIAPAITGPRMGAARIGIAAKPRTLTIRLPAARAIIICAIGASRPPRMPCRVRNPIKEFADHASPHSVEESVNAEKHPR
jgi:hypothetical protein